MDESKTTKLTVLVGGATGKQGGAVANLLLERGHNVIAYVRSADSPQAKALQGKGARLATGDLTDASALAQAAQGANAIFSMTTSYVAGGTEEEIRQGKALADAALQLGIHLVYSSVAGARANSGVAHFESKGEIEKYIKEKGVKATTLEPVYFMENLYGAADMLKQGVYAVALPPELKLRQVTLQDIAGMAVYALEHPEEMIGQTVELASDSLTGLETADVLSRVLGKEIKYQQMPMEQVRAWSEEAVTMFEWIAANDGFGVDVEALHKKYPEVQWHSFEDWLRGQDLSAFTE